MPVDADAAKAHGVGAWGELLTGRDTEIYVIMDSRGNTIYIYTLLLYIYHDIHIYIT